MQSKKCIELSSAIERGDFLPYFQPLVDLRTGDLRGFEVLARWAHPTQGIVLPGAFIHDAEENGLIGLLSESVLAQAFKCCGRLDGTFTLSVNISPIQFRDRSLPERLARLAEASQFPCGRIKVEITESTLLENVAEVQPIAEQLKILGMRLSLDDFGTGYSSLANLQALPFDELKVDRSFVNSMCCRRESMKIVAAVVGLGRSLGLITVAEGVEDAEQAEMLRCLGCEVGQGWLYGKPVPEQALADLLATKGHFPSNDYSDKQPSEDTVSFLEALPAERHAQLQAVYDGVPVGLCFIDRDLRYVSINRRLAEMNGLTVRSHLGRTLEEMIPESYLAVLPYMTRALEGEAIDTVELQRKNCRLAVQDSTVLMTFQPAKDEKGEVIGVSVAVVDISDRKTGERALAESEDHFRHMVELNPQIPYTMNSHGLIVDVSQRWEELTGLPLAESFGRGWLQVVHPDDLAELLRISLSAIRAGKQVDVTFRVVGKDGLWHWMRSRAAPRKNSQRDIIRWYGSLELIDDQKEAEDKLLASQMRLQAIINALPVGVVIAEAPSGRIVARNPKAESILRQDPLEFEQVSDYAKRVAYHSHGRRLEAREFPIAKAIEHGESTEAQPVYYGLEDGTGKWLSLSGAPLRDKEGRVVGAVATIQEVAGEQAKRADAVALA